MGFLLSIATVVPRDAVPGESRLMRLNVVFPLESCPDLVFEMEIEDGARATLLNPDRVG
jgi:hypothetical protein